MKIKVASFISLLLFFSNAQSAPITYEFSGIGSGSLDSTSFLDKAFNIKIFGDTDDVVDPSVNLDLTTGLTSLFTIGGIGQGSFTDPLFVFGGLGENFLGFGTFPGDGNLIAFFGPVNNLAGYDLKSDFGPIVEINDNLGQFDDASTTIGKLAFDSMSPVTFKSTLTDVPEPSILALIGAGLAGLGFARRCKHRS